ncbi:hypothetical protein [Aquabacterium sp. OR-4]|uniref:hypothetical protein n=1 Tax=Aquabacterium sp. OR-4 TaxID=2978127 RepID=UPI0021B4295B|nr:hypothetical protein [Aquabacterium sp. OR-4]MDT7838640.1 hypothetical protein [Aquabacterium sp. OR-4]
MTTAHRAHDTPPPAALLRWWDRIGIGVRCAYNPRCACAVRLYLEAGRRVAAEGAWPELPTQRRCLELLLQTARDPALPWTWRNLCVEHAVYPQARLQSLLGCHDPVAMQAIDCAVQSVRDLLAGLARSPGSAA